MPCPVEEPRRSARGPLKLLDVVPVMIVRVHAIRRHNSLHVCAVVGVGISRSHSGASLWYGTIPLGPDASSYVGGRMACAAASFSARELTLGFIKPPQTACAA